MIKRPVLSYDGWFEKEHNNSQNNQTYLHIEIGKVHDNTSVLRALSANNTHHIFGKYLMIKVKSSISTKTSLSPLY